MNSTAPISRISASETSPTTSAALTLPWRNPVPERLLLSLSEVTRSVRDALNAGKSPKRIPVSSETASVKLSTRQSTPMAEPSSPMRGRPAGLTASRARTPAKPSAKPKTPPVTESKTLSVSSWRTMRMRLAPRAERTASSRLRPVARTSSRLATLAQAMSSTRATAPSMISSDLRASPMIRSRSGSTANRSRSRGSFTGCWR
jgi:hypothetical protein